MWPWRKKRKRVEVVLVEEAGDDAIATLTMILRYHGKSATFDEVRHAIFQDRSGPANALEVVTAAEHFRLHGRGLRVDEPAQLAGLPTPNIAHMAWEPRPFPRGRDEFPDGFFAVVVEILPDRVRWIDPYTGEMDDDRRDFLARASGVFLAFDGAAALPAARRVTGRN